jgi:hypothetical protein
MPLQFTTDCGSETTQLHGLASALRYVFFLHNISIVVNSSCLYFREILHPDFDLRELPAHIYLRSIHNISIERSWLRLRLDWGDNAVVVFEKGKEEGIYNPDDPQH